MSSVPSFTVFDVETTGLEPRKGHKIIEIAGLRVENGVIDETKTFVSLVNPERPIPWEAKQVNKISDELVQNAPTIDQVLPKFLEFAQGSFLVAHNAAFDMSFLDCEKELCWGYIDLPECFCTMRMSQRAFPQDFGHSLDAVARRLNLQLPQNRHRALPDVILTAHALVKMLGKMNVGSVDELRTAAGLRTMVR